MVALQTFIRRKTFLTIGACFALGVSAPQALAGFEWVPQKNTAAPAAEQAPKAAPVISVADEQFLPLPSDVELQEPEMTSPAPEITELDPAPVDLAPQPTFNAAPSSPSRVSMMPKRAPNSGAVRVQKAAELPPLPEPVPEPIEDYSPEVLKKPPFEMTKTRIIVPEDAPAGAVEQVEKRNSQIMPFPSAESLEDTQEPPVTFTSDAPATQAIQAVAPMENAVGFAEDVPLALALRQVVPSEYAFSFGKNVNPGLRVSWNGGKPWNEVVADMVTSLGYEVVISHKSVLIVAQKQAMAPSSTPAYIEPAAGTADDAELGMMPAMRERKIKRINIVDPGSENAATDTREKGFLQKVTDIFEPMGQPTPTTSVASNDLPSLTDAEPSQKITFWTAQAGASLKDTINQWSNNANAKLVWDAAHDYQIATDFEVQGSFEKAVSLLLEHGTNAKNNALDISYASTSGNEKMEVIIGDKA